MYILLIVKQNARLLEFNHKYKPYVDTKIEILERKKRNK